MTNLDRMEVVPEEFRIFVGNREAVRALYESDGSVKEVKGW